MYKDILKAPDEIAWKLDKYQLAATQAPLGNTCVFAVAGSGKTTLLTHRVANLIYHGVNEEDILLLTFTNQAAEEMTSRVKKILKKEDIKITSGTFHSVANTMLRKFDAKRISIMDEDEALDCIKRAYKLALTSEEQEILNGYKVKYRNIYYMLSSSINHNRSFKAQALNEKPKLQTYALNLMEKVVVKYKELKKEIFARDFDDLLVDVLDLIKNNDKARNYYREKFKYIFVDEYQDVNHLQYEFLFQINKYDNLFVVGDRAQCIYQFRGSKDEYMDSFETDYKDVSTYFLKNNYRSEPGILQFAENSVNHNNFKYKVEAIPALTPSGASSVYIKEFYDDLSQARNIANYIQNNFKESEYDNICLLFRTNNQTALFEKEFAERNMPFEVIGALTFFQRAHIKIFVNVLRFLDNKDNFLAFEKVATLFSGIGRATAEKIYKRLKETYAFNFKEMIKKDNFKKEQELELIRFLQQLSQQEKVDEIVEVALTSELVTIIEDKYPDNYDERLDDLKMLSKIGFNINVSDFLDKVALLDVPDEKNDEPKIKLMTVHKAKGKEWEYVFLPYMQDNYYPMIFKSKNYEQDVKNERNLFYVAVTRAKKKIFVSTCQQEFTYGMEKEVYPSVFLLEATKEI